MGEINGDKDVVLLGKVFGFKQDLSLISDLLNDKYPIEAGIKDLKRVADSIYKAIVDYQKACEEEG